MRLWKKRARHVDLDIGTRIRARGRELEVVEISFHHELDGNARYSIQLLDARGLEKLRRA